MGIVDRLNQLDRKAGAFSRYHEPDPALRDERLRLFLKRPMSMPYVPPIVVQELLYLRARVDALEAQVQSLASESGP